MTDNLKGRTIDLLTAATATGAGVSHEPWGENRTYEARGTTSAGAGAATIVIEVSNDDTNWMTLGTITLTLATTVAAGTPGVDGFASAAMWRYTRARVSAISGTGAAVTVILGN